MSWGRRSVLVPTTSVSSPCVGDAVCVRLCCGRPQLLFVKNLGIFVASCSYFHGQISKQVFGWRQHLGNGAGGLL